MPEVRKQQTPVNNVNSTELPHDKTKSRQTQSKSETLSPYEKRIALITAMGQFRPKNATPIQFYNYVREFCIMHNCSIDEAMERAPVSWTKLSTDQRQLYDSEMHAALPIPVPRHLVYRAFQMERAGRWKLSSVPAGKGGSIMYSVEAYAPPTKPTRMQSRIRSQQPRYDNLAETSPCFLESTRHTNAPKKLRTLTPPEQRAQRAQQAKTTCSLSLTRILSEVSLNGRRSGRAANAGADNNNDDVGATVLTNDGTKKPVKCKSKKKLLGGEKKKRREEISQTELKRKHPNKKHKKKEKK